MASQNFSEKDDVERRFHAAGVVVPADRAAGTYAGARRLLSSLHWLRQPRPAAAEPSNTFVPARDVV